MDSAKPNPVDPTKRFVTAVLAAGVLVLICAIVLGERMGDRVMAGAAESGSNIQSPLVTPLPESTATAAYGPDWKSNQALAAAPDPRFPDPRIPPKPLPTLPPTPKPTPTPRWTPNPNVPIWDQTPPGAPSSSPAAAPSPDDDTTVASPEPLATP